MEQASYQFLFKVLGIFVVALIAMISVAAFVPQRFPIGTQVHIEKNSSLTTIADSLAQQHIIASPFLFKVAAVVSRSQKKIVAGDYRFDKPLNLWAVFGRLTRGDYALIPIKVTIPEGSTVADVAWYLMKKIPNFNAPYFVRIALPFEGYLFPDTYTFYSNTSPDDVLSALRKNFDTQLKTLTTDITLSGKKPADIVTMASILEREATSTTDRAIIAGILWKRIDEGMPLQVDSTVVYLTGDSYTSIDDTKIDSHYNTYKYKGLPKGPISNPGIDALRTAAQPVKTPYYYYLSDKRGNIHYATTAAGHLVNREKYLNK